MTELQALRTDYRARKAQLLDLVASPIATVRQVRKVLQRMADLTDEVLRQLWSGAGLAEPYALLAVGGYGRAELFPHSDVDVLVLLPDGHSADTDSDLKKRIETFIGNCWDVGLEIGSSVRTLSDCLQEAEKDVTVQTALLECRLITGNADLVQAFRKAFTEAMDPKAFFVAKTLEMRQRHTKFEDTPYSLEPNCKESPGGLRDLQVILWVAKAAGYGDNWADLARGGLATEFEVKQIERNEALLLLIRAKLHFIAKRREDRLIFDLQNAVAESFGYTAGSPEGDRKQLVRASEALMKRYYWAAKAVTQLNQILLMNIEERLNPSTHAPRRINDHFNDKAGMIDVASDDLYRRNPHAILETFLVYQTTVGIKGLSARTLRALYNARDLMDAKYRRDPINRATFLQIMQAPDGITHAMRLMNQTSVLGRYLWVFRKIVGQMQHDLFHVYTVDQHILMVLRNARRFFMVEHAHEYPFCSQLASGWDKPWILYIASLFHDIAKGRGGDHSELGIMEARRFCKEHGVPADDAKLIEFLVGEHLTMSRIAQKSDLSDPDVIQEFAKRVGNERYLTALYLLTVADIRGTSPKVWNAWKGKLLEDLYKYTARALGGRAPDADAEVEQRKREALVMVALYALPFEAHKPLWDTLDVGYFMRHDAADIAWHTKQLSRLVATDQPIVRARRSPVGEGLQVVVYTQDQPDLFARICGYFDQGGFSILDARIHTTKKGYALDTFQVVTSADMDEHYREMTSMLENGLAQAIAEAGPLPAPSRGRVSRRVKSFPIAPRVSLKPDEKAQRWLLNISASDRLGLLYCIARVLAKHQIVVQLAKVATLGERVEDTFLIHGAQLQHNRAQIDIETEILDALAV
ncbi:Bifunctional uridylyltransferase/uridylyl-removing enzyme [Curvibacter sp. AEP1-3]|uniref:[protein-PII] uridylyltransferase n=1 Tax=Curvibacter sp. AEP1-3 TaxID=1844971 RepID=UPI000B3D1172|nr:[protein-PII] uridylyltransferase [Curvibacter sp. AEP1-3]ARV17437.1 Bifunctional uridylyltransferase/uridylyl-removing enzyme [Curvibacter sp. AEP1-3]